MSLGSVLLNFFCCTLVNEAFAVVVSGAVSEQVSERVSGALALLAGAAVLVQAVVFLHASGVVFGNARTERFFDLTGSLTFISLTLLAVHLRGGVQVLSSRQKLLALAVLLWASRLGSFLFARIRRHGGVDDRFTAVKPDLARFSRFWGIQGVWVFLTALPVFLVVSIPHEVSAPLVARDFVGLGLWLLGFSVEVVADRQKACRADKTRFIDTGLWSISRHPNYFGEICLWVGVSVSASNSFTNTGHWVALISPAIVVLLLIKVSGIPLLEAIANKKYSEDPQYKAYKGRVPVLVPFIGRAGDAAF